MAVVHVDKELPNAPRLNTVIEASNEIIQHCEGNKIESLVELAHVARKSFEKTAIAKSLNLRLVYDTDEDAIRIDGRPTQCVTNKVDNCFCMFGLSHLLLDDAVSQFGADRSGFQVEYDSDHDVIKELA